MTGNDLETMDRMATRPEEVLLSPASDKREFNRAILSPESPTSEEFCASPVKRAKLTLPRLCIPTDTRNVTPPSDSPPVPSMTSVPIVESIEIDTNKSRTASISVLGILSTSKTRAAKVKGPAKHVRLCLPSGIFFPTDDVIADTARPYKSDTDESDTTESDDSGDDGITTD